MNFFFILAAIVMLGFMVMIHECGHFFAARLTGIPVKEFAIGFGPKLASWKSKKYDTRFFIRLIPAGGYCMFYGEDDTAGKEQQDPRCINRFAPWKRMITIAMGPVMNFVLAFVAAVILFSVAGQDAVGRAVISEVTAGGPAARAGIQAGDVIDEVNGQKAEGVTEDGNLPAVAMISAYRAGDPPLEMILERKNAAGETDRISVSVTPDYSEAEGRPLIGITVGYEVLRGAVPVSFWQAIPLGADYCVRAGGAILSGLKNMLTTGEGFDQSAGPVGIVQLIAEETRANGWEMYLQLLVMISVNLGLFNLIPIPGLDGSRIIFLVIEAVRRKPVNQRVEAGVHMAGYALLMGLMLFMTCKDILHIFQ